MRNRRGEKNLLRASARARVHATRSRLAAYTAAFVSAADATQDYYNGWLGLLGNTTDFGK